MENIVAKDNMLSNSKILRYYRFSKTPPGFFSSKIPKPRKRFPPYFMDSMLESLPTRPTLQIAMLLSCIICLDYKLIYLYSLKNPELEEWNNEHESKYVDTAKRMHEAKTK